MTVSVEIETVIDRPPADVFAALIDVERYPEWLIASGIVRVERLDPGPLRAGSRLRISQTVAGRSTVLDGSVTELAPAAAFGLRGKDKDGVTIEIDAALAPARVRPRGCAGRSRSSCRSASGCSNRWSRRRRSAPPRSTSRRSSAAWSRPPPTEPAARRPARRRAPRSAAPMSTSVHPGARRMPMPAARARPTFRSSGSHHGRPAGRSQTPCSIRTSSAPGKPLPIAPTVPAGACLVAGCTCKDARIISFRRAAFFAAMARRTGETADREIAPDPEWRIPTFEGV